VAEVPEPDTRFTRLIRLVTASVGPLDTEVGIAVGIELADGLLSVNRP
jgi:hypothetical protein